METQVAIVGAGPVGLGLAVDLGQRGVDVVLLEKTTSVHDIPKGQNLTQRTMEHLRCWGVEAEVRRARLMPADYPASGVNAFGSLLSGYSHLWFKRSQVDPYYFAASERLPQYLTEAVMRERVSDLESVTALYGRKVIGLETSGDGATAITDDGLRVDARYLVGCDGSHSVVRDSAGIGETTTDHDRRMVLLVFRSTELHDIVETSFGPSAFFNILDPDLDGYWRFLGRVDVGEQWFFHAPVDPDAPPETLDHDALLHESVGAPFDLDLEHVGFWDLRIAAADVYRRGAVLIAGDAAHSHPPYGGYGINTGLEDVRNLGWKLAAALGGWAGEGLLDSYDLERRPVFLSTAHDFIEAFIERDREFVGRHDPSSDEADFARAWDQRRQIAATVGVGDFEPHYEGSPIVFGPDAGQTSAAGEHSFTPRAGHHLTPPGPGATDLFSRLGPGFTFIGDAGHGADLAEVAVRNGVPLEVVDDARYGAEILVRPDHYISWVGEAATCDAEAILKRSVGG